MPKVGCETLSGTTNYLYDGMGTRANIIEEVDDLANVQARYAQTLAIDQPLAEFRSGTTSFYEQDALSSVSSLSNSAGVLANTYTYDSFGEALTSSGTLVNDMRHTGRELDLESSLVYYRHRFYDPAIGRFLNEDENEFYGGTNFYSYVNNSPLVYVDPFGLARCVLSVYEQTLICFPELPGHDAVIIPVASGNNGGGMECKNDPTCDPIPDQGPIPRGDWEWTKDKTTKPDGRVLKPKPGTFTWDRTLFRSHSCKNAFGPSAEPPFCSGGCITGSPDDIKRLNKLIDSEPGSTVHVTDWF